MPVIDKELTKLNQQKHDLVRAHIGKKINDTKFEAKYAELDNIIRTKTKEAVIKLRADFESKPIKTYVSDTKLGPKIKGCSYSSTIGRVLADPKIKDIHQAIDAVDNEKPGRDRKKIRVHIQNIIRIVRSKKQPRWAKFKFDKRSFMLTKDETWRE